MNGPPDPHRVLGVSRDAGLPEITAAYRRLVRAAHPDGHRPDPERLAEVIAAYRLLRARAEPRVPPPAGKDIPVRRRSSARPDQPDLRAGPVRRHPS